MRKSTIITTVIAISICLCAFFWQSKRISALEAKSRTLQEKIVASPDPASAPTQSESATATGNQADPIVPTANVPSAAELRSLWPNGIDLEDLTNTATAIPKLVAAVKDWTPAQLLAVAGELIEEGSRRSDRFLTQLLLIIVAEEQPEAALAFWDEHHALIDRHETVRSALLSELAKTNPALAIKRIERDALDPDDLRRGRVAVGQHLLKNDVTAGLELLSKGARSNPRMVLNGLGTGIYGSRTAVQVAARDPQVAASLWRELNQLESGRGRSILLNGLLEKEAIEGDAASVAEAFAKLENSTAEERDEALQFVAMNLREDDPVGTIDLLRQYGSNPRRSQWIVSTFGYWAKYKPEEASAWLSEESASPNRDQMIVELTERITKSDAASAITWARNISDEELRAKTVKTIEKLHGGPVSLPEE